MTTKSAAEDGIAPVIAYEDIPVIEYDAIEAEFKNEGVDVRDLMNGKNHYDDWFKRTGLPVTDEQGKHCGSSQIYYARYRQDPEGDAAKPAYIDLWHQLLELGKEGAWTEEPGRRHKRVLIAERLIVVPEHPDAKRLAEGRARLEANMGAPLPEEAWQVVVDQAMLERPRWAKTREIITEIVRRHGVEAPGLGRLALVNLRVDC